MIEKFNTARAGKNPGLLVLEVLPVLLLVFSLVLLLGFSGQGMAQSGAPRDCADIDGDRERLACYDRAVNAGEPRAPASGESSGPASPPGGKSTPEVDGFGLENKQAVGEELPRERTFTVAEARHNDFTGWTIEFGNGQVWRQVGTGDYRIEVGESYTIKRASFNSFLLGNERNSRKIRVTRSR